MPEFEKARLNRVLLKIGRASEKIGLNAYLVGGAVRDLLTGKKSLDWDIVAEGNPAPLVKAAAKLVRGRVKAYPRFGTFSLETRKGFRIDFATTRKETYARPGALPSVVFSGLEGDLFRRDFTLNALAVRLGGSMSGEIIDYFGGKRDLKNRVLRILHRKSFKDDPTRLFRLARFAARGYRIDKLTDKIANACAGYVGRVSAERVSRELLLIMEENSAFEALEILKRWGIIERLLPGIEIRSTDPKLRKLKNVEGRLAFLLSNAAKASRAKIYSSLKFSNKLKRSIEKLLEAKKAKPALNGGDLLAMGYRQGPLIGRILEALSRSGIVSRPAAKRYVFDNYPQKI